MIISIIDDFNSLYLDGKKGCLIFPTIHAIFQFIGYDYRVFYHEYYDFGT